MSEDGKPPAHAPAVGERRLFVRARKGKRLLEEAELVKFIVPAEDDGGLWKVRFISDGLYGYRYLR